MILRRRTIAKWISCWRYGRTTSSSAIHKARKLVKEHFAPSRLLGSGLSTLILPCVELVGAESPSH
jgi:hypothetical protein